MVQVVLVGVNHNDPLGRLKIKHILENELSGFIPNCVGVEWKEEIAKAVISQRDDMEKQMKNKYPFFNDSMIKQFAMSLAFETDSHQFLYPEIPIIWLDRERNVDVNSDRIKTYSLDRMSILEMIINRNGIDTIEGVSDLICKSAYENSADDRDKSFYEVLKTELLREKYERILCIVGVKHSDESIKGSFADSLKRDGIRVLTIDSTVISLTNIK